MKISIPSDIWLDAHAADANGGYNAHEHREAFDTGNSLVLFDCPAIWHVNASVGQDSKPCRVFGLGQLASNKRSGSWDDPITLNKSMFMDHGVYFRDASTSKPLCIICHPYLQVAPKDSELRALDDMGLKLSAPNIPSWYAPSARVCVVHRKGDVVEVV